jgi:hypothetical protein
LAEILLAYKRAYAPDADGSVWMFPNPDTGRLWWPYQIQQHYIRKAEMEALNLDHIGWHAVSQQPFDVNCSRSGTPIFARP